MPGLSPPLTRAQLHHIAQQRGVPVEVVEKDYLLGYLLAGIARAPAFGGLHFKGGTALKKIYFGDYRFSEDLDFSAIAAPRGAEMDQAIRAAIIMTEERLVERGRFHLEFDRPPKRGPHPTGQDAFRIRAAFPWQRAPMVRVKIEITHDEPILLPAVNRPLMHDYQSIGDDLGEVLVRTYALEEVVTEKLRALRQLQRTLDRRGWARPRARDYYDLWRILSQHADTLDAESIRRVLPRKFSHRAVGYEAIDDFFTAPLMAEARRHWQSNLGNFVPNLPNVDTVLAELRPLIETLLAPA